MTTLRTFIALPLPDEAKVVLRSVTQALSVRVPDKAVRFVRPEQVHLTLRFLGDTNVDQLPAIMDVVDRIADGRAPILLQLDEVGCFPNVQRPRVIWVGLTGEINQLQALTSDL
ncbi:MAG TPA: RNA 2',3'-cyclic phosphodiesterase, partial [Promineifilum sp.]